MTLQQLEYFLAAYRHGSFSGAARGAAPGAAVAVGAGPAARGRARGRSCSRASAAGVAPTEAGETLRPHAERDAGRRRGRARVGRRGARAARRDRHVRDLGRPPATTPAPRSSPSSAAATPRCACGVIGQNSFEVVEAVRRGEIEAGMVALPIDDRGLDVQPIMRDEIVYASVEPRAPAPRDDDRGARRGAADPLRRELGHRRPDAPAARGARPAAPGVTIEPQIDVEDVEAAIELAARGLGDTIVARAMLLALGRRVPRRLGWVPFDRADLRPVRVHLAPRRPPVARQPRVPAAGARSASPRSRETLETRPPRRRRPGR